MKKYFIYSLVSALVLPFAAQAAKPQLIGEYDDWSAYYYRDGEVCYMASSPQKDEGKYTRRGNIYVTVTHRPREKSFDVVNVNAGYTYDVNKPAVIKIGTQKFELFTDGDKAWTRTIEDDENIVKAMKRGSRMIIDGVSNRGTKTKDTYSLNGFSAAYKAISNKCKK